MINWLWVIPWIAIIIFVFGWFLGSKWTHRQERRMQYQDREIEIMERHYGSEIDALHTQIRKLEERLERNICELQRSKKKEEDQ